MVSPNLIIYSIPFLMVLLVFLLANIDLKRKRGEAISSPFISFIVPCFNEENEVCNAIKSIYDSYDNFELFVINDKSKDNSLENLRKLNKIYPFELINNKRNIGKSKSINKVAARTSGEIIFIVDSDVILTRKAIDNVLERFDYNEKVAAVSCPYKPKGYGLLVRMQEIDYNISKMTKYAHNNTSVLSAWGGCLAIKRKPFFEVKKFSENALIEDVDLALKLNKKGYKVEQSSIPVVSGVPLTFKALIKQRIRWTSGGAQCFITHTKTYFKNPLQIIFGAAQLILIATFVYYFSQYATSFVDLVDNLFSFNSSGNSEFIQYLSGVEKNVIINGVFVKFGLMIFVLPYLVITLKSIREFYKVFYIIPFTIIYSPLLTGVWLYGWGRGVKKYFELKNSKKRGW